MILQTLNSKDVSRIETEMLLEHLFNCERIDLYTKDFIISEDIKDQYGAMIKRRLKGEPVQYVIGHAEFMGLDFMVTKDTFIPRPETELLVNEVCRGGFASHRGAGYPGARHRGETLPYILDLCTGSGNIAVTLAKLMPEVEIIATDISEPALKIAEKNAVLHNVKERIKFYQGDLFDALAHECVDNNPKFDIIICNPPYIKEYEILFLQKEVTEEPEIALNGGKDGLDFYRIIAEEAPGYLKKSGSIVLETGFGQAEAIKEIFSLRGIFKIYKTMKDFAGIDRALWINLL